MSSKPRLTKFTALLITGFACAVASGCEPDRLVRAWPPELTGTYVATSNVYTTYDGIQWDQYEGGYRLTLTLREDSTFYGDKVARLDSLGRPVHEEIKGTWGVVDYVVRLQPTQSQREQ